ncbi:MULTISPECIES: NAD-dependent epimerase/dehydratase family protein [Streptomyces]|uniref:NAD-dependent epimerase/dehydratase family protein n=1 Tax=Streptomyces doudnae TaxID=3075536 RepID=A0ABD5EPS0_9ACTN|nr:MULTISPECIES: NAD-dependent epimerase/dehydratase family protein [unclassified Streptomyces]MDT0436354.1 NAD-dependent epimerase/dehydratase family protein [Streptomyces sp. DSM 41981]MYQ62246.1 NAD-dependent epimerase/dehydratase family protein [Streptomyces sp. SID4950]SCD33417.1 Nucleoside-diphosphate-sugar epimerase [Streptomyces sp. SolWspMP-5a-2]
MVINSSGTAPAPRPPLPARVAITGAAGVLGVNLAERLAASGTEVHAFDRRTLADAPGLTVYTGDIRDPAALAEAFRDVDAVVHSASALPSYSASDIRSIVVEGTTTVLEAARAAAVPRVVHISTTAVYGLPRTVPTPEDYPKRPVDHYSSAKAEAEEVAERFRAEGMSLSVLRPKTFLGPTRMGLFDMLFQWAEEGRNFPVLGTGDVRIQMLGVADLVDAVLIALRAPDEIACDTYNIGAAEFGTLREDFQCVLDAAGHGKRVVSIPSRPAVAALRALSRVRLSPVYDRLTHKLLADSYMSIDKAREKLGFRPQLSNQDAILQSYEWWRTRRATSSSGAGVGRTSGDPWRQGMLAMAKVFF